MKLLVIAGMLLMGVLPDMGSAQSNTPPCSSPEASQFDFWVGGWELTWNDTSKGFNSISKAFDGCVIREQFSDSANGYFGGSLSVYNQKKKVWEQTWVDNAGNFMIFEGRLENGQMILGRSVLDTAGNSIQQRMVFLNISSDSLDWRWESSADGGTTWKENWFIHYRRK